MKKTATLWLFLSLVVPAWAADEASAPAMPAVSKPAASAVAPAGEISVNIELKGSARNVAAVASEMEKETVYKDAFCSTQASKKPAKAVQITCAKANSELMTYLSKNATAKVHWSITPASCATGCVQMNCPPPNGPLECCKKTSSGYKPC